MNLLTALRVFAVSFAALLLIDFAWLGLVAKRFYSEHLGTLLRPDVQWAPAIIFYLLFVAGLMVFVIVPAVERGSLTRALSLGAFFGLVAYATYDLTSLSLIRGFPLIVAIVDLAWGAFIAAAVSGIGYTAARWFAS